MANSDNRIDADNSKPPRTEPLVLTLTEGAQLARISPASFRAGVAAGLIPHISIGRRILIPRAKLIAFLEGESGK